MLIKVFVKALPNNNANQLMPDWLRSWVRGYGETP